jgi:hypothetical protein
MLSMTLSESDLRKMPPALRDPLLKWYFERNVVSLESTEPAVTSIDSPVAPDSKNVPENSEETDRRVTFGELVRARLLSAGDELYCRALKRQKKSGAGPYIQAGRVAPDGRVEFQGQKYSKPSNLAVTVVNASGGRVQALNGYDYLFVKCDGAMVPLNSLRNQLRLSEEVMVDTLIADGQVFRDRPWADRFVREYGS